MLSYFKQSKSRSIMSIVSYYRVPDMRLSVKFVSLSVKFVKLVAGIN